MELLAHISENGRRQTLREHLENVAHMAASFAAQFGMSNCAFLCGLVHDLGKSSTSFQRHIRGEHTPANYHKDAGARLLWELDLPYLAMVVDGHHGGLNDYDTWSYVARGRDGDVPASTDVCEILGIDENMFSKFVDAARAEWNAHMSRWLCLRSEAHARGNCRDVQVNFEAQFAVRMLFSCLVDADFIDTERACLDDDDAREPFDYDIDLLDTYESYMSGKTGADDPISLGRTRLNHAACQAGDEQRGLRQLSADTGLGKTLTSLGFALHSMRANDLNRVIYSIPFNTISDQTYNEFRNIFGDELVLEATSSFDVEDNDDESPEVIRRKVLLTENWDSTFVITSNVQFFESLFANKTSACRKLHNIAGSVLVFDEVQSFDETFAEPTIATLELLVRDYGCDVLMMSATCPDFSEIGLTTFGTPIRKITWDNGTSHEAAFSRVNYIDLGIVCVNDLIDKIDCSGQTLFVLNTRRQAKLLFEHVVNACKDNRLSVSIDDVIFLSNDLCPVSRERALNRVISYLDMSGENHDKPCIIVSTTIVEAGINIDAQYVFRCISGADNILQAGGRANRHGYRNLGIVYLFDFSADDEMSDDKWALMRARKRLTREHMTDANAEGHTLSCVEFWDWVIEGYLIDRYENRRGWRKGFEGIVDVEGSSDDVCFNQWDFRRWSKTYKLIRDTGVTVFVPIDEEGVSLFKALADGRRVSRKKLRRYCVNASQQTFENLVKNGYIVDFNGVNCVELDFVDKVYDPVTGLHCEIDSSSEKM